jgi:hypothetical protein
LLLQRRIGLLEDLKAKRRFPHEFEKWHRDTEIAIENIFGDNSRHVEDFTSIHYDLPIASTATPDYKFDEYYRRSLDSAAAVLNSMIDEITEYWDDEVGAAPRSAISIIAGLYDGLEVEVIIVPKGL